MAYFLQWLVFGSPVTVVGAVGAFLVVGSMMVSSFCSTRQKAQAELTTAPELATAAGTAEDIKKIEDDKTLKEAFLTQADGGGSDAAVHYNVVYADAI